MATLPLTKGYVALVDDGDYRALSQWKWTAMVTRCGVYAKRCIFSRKQRRNKTLLLHRELLHAKKGEMVYHANGNTLDNRRANLRMVSSSQNHMNQRKTRGSSMYKGVSWEKRRSLWQTTIKKDGKMHFLGYFDNEQDAAIVYNVAATLFFGEYARLNPL